ncbi:beta-carotene 15,15'-monooxygenase [Chryseobacterium lactis]|uniref:Beta-carotene 15,15'-monooxygenase n=1 Tax=Chryseobacterium lactis TaxID=1241981 RepID=A0A3G6RI92_CHRLC|nr:beta-carotene 15,15'-monooxygenase [Chryseobacterium lactis]AZA83188.1 beta-carotene 15,15'-monooxygenase [Chryseobacterium lactis]AZB03573.1 beta-carotene 15,15'-monooxygenase [Chryseobacterium lactis]PNW11921.1 beta-carotene 15,15'-monooxygenase [Chryseobacterium lactis]
MANRKMPFFKSWAPEWLVKIILFAMTLPGIIIFFLPLANVNAAAGYYGCEPADIQFSVALFYAGYVGFYSLERRFFSFLAAKEYFLLFTTLQIVACLICYFTQEIYILFPVRFIQGMLFAGNVNLSLSQIFTRLNSERGREISFSVFFGILICATPFNNLITADLIDSYNFNIVYKTAIFSYLPGLVFLTLMMSNYRTGARFHLYKLDWQSFAVFSTMLVLIGYIMIFGQEYYWLEDYRIMGSVIGIIVLTAISVFRQNAIKRPYIDLRVFKYRNFKVGLLILFVMYICRFASGITNNFFATELHLDPFYISYINIFNLCGLVVGVIIACCMVLQKKRIQYIWGPGFLMLLLFHALMYYSFDVQADEFNYYIPLFLQGLGVGLIMVPTIIYIISSVPAYIGPSAAATALAVRYLGFCASIALINYFELFEKSRHYNAFQDHLSAVDPAVKNFLHRQTGKLTAKGMLEDHAVKASQKLLIGKVNIQNHVRFAMDYYEMMVWLLAGVLLLIFIFPYLNRTALYLKSRRLSPA